MIRFEKTSLKLVLVLKDIVYLSAQPAENYFLWQLELQLRNFCSLGIKKEQIHVLLAVGGLNQDEQALVTFIKEHTLFANIYCYQDRRSAFSYSSSIRPNIIKQHFEKYPELALVALFYHDSDIIFSRLPNLDMVIKDEVSYVSDTRSYISSRYIQSVSSELFLKEMADIVGIELACIYKNDNDAGGAQYLLKGINSIFWDKVERDAEELFKLMTKYNLEKWMTEYPVLKKTRTKTKGIQAWCADMWAVLWNLWYFDKKVQIHPELNFNWPFSPVTQWEKFPILHYSGDQKSDKNFFKKTRYIRFPPWYDDKYLHELDNNNCSYPLKELICKRRLELDNKRPEFEEISIIIYVDQIDEDQLFFLEVTEKYIKKNIKINVLMWSLDEKLVPDSDMAAVSYVLNTQHLLSKIKVSTASHYLVYHARAFANINTICELLKEVKATPNISHIYKPEIICAMDMILVQAFSKVLDEIVFLKNTGKGNKKQNLENSFLLVHKSKFQSISTNIKAHQLLATLSHNCETSILNQDVFSFGEINNHQIN